MREKALNDEDGDEEKDDEDEEDEEEEDGDKDDNDVDDDEDEEEDENEDDKGGSGGGEIFSSGCGGDDFCFCSSSFRSVFSISSCFISSFRSYSISSDAESSASNENGIRKRVNGFTSSDSSLHSAELSVDE